MKGLDNSSCKKEELTKSTMYSFYFEDPKEPVEREFNNVKLEYFYFDSELKLRTDKKEILNGSLLEGKALLIYEKSKFDLNQYDLFFIPPEKKFTINPKHKCKICLVFSLSRKEVDAEFEIQRFNLEKFTPRGEFGSEHKMATYRTVWTAIKNGFFMSGFTNIPMEALKQGVVTSVNLEDDCIFSHVHPDFPEVYIYCIDDEHYAVTQYLVNSKGQSVCKDLSNGGGIFFPGKLGHMNFSKPHYRDLRYCLYLWIIPTFGIENDVRPITLRILDQK
ncbi:MAG: hypothetical protein ACFFAQ_08690 [Promethearchaeota archaeon]